MKVSMFTKEEMHARLSLGQLILSRWKERSHFG